MKKQLFLITTLTCAGIVNNSSALAIPKIQYSGVQKILTTVSDATLKLAEANGHFFLDHPRTALLVNAAVIFGVHYGWEQTKKRCAAIKAFFESVARHAGTFGFGVLATLTYQKLNTSLISK